MHGLKIEPQGNHRVCSVKSVLSRGSEPKCPGQQLDNDEERIVNCSKFLETSEEVVIGFIFTYKSL